ncbi:M81 family metallopeptidase [Mesorhizobium sp.]|uniref:M81 family metallopeptidase n=1 Tax=Mesorhizobium sp. TaxID=1871066 RepID=UPI0012114D9F|nr:M81 family metallopeptidase [Mesorhizobium sp.]TIO24069.1 MAG: M81 family metallopeptidase [Mesorhizobium sp.]
MTDISNDTSIRIAVLHFSHETVTFLPTDTTLDDFLYEGSPVGGEQLLQSDPTGYMGGFVKVAREHYGVKLVGIDSPLWPKTGTGSGWIMREAYEHFATRMVTELLAQGPFDGIYMVLHGAMAVRGVERPEADLARRVREVVGSRVCIAATFDPHGNEDESFLKSANLAYVDKYYPHYDSYLQGTRAARGLIRAIRGDYLPVHASRKVPILSPTVLQWTGAPAWMALAQRALTWEAREPDACVNVFFGFPWADVPDVGMTIQAITNNTPELAARIVDDMAAYAWRQRASLLADPGLHSIADGVEAALAAVARNSTPVVIADHSDRSGAATWLLSECLEQETSKTLFATIVDPDTIDRLHASGSTPGYTFDMLIGGRVDASAGVPVRIQGTLEAIADDWATIRFGKGNLLILSRNLVQITEPGELHRYRVSAEHFEIIAIKSRVHFRRGFDDTGFAREIILVEPTDPFLGTVRLTGLDYRAIQLDHFYPYGEPSFP